MRTILTCSPFRWSLFIDSTCRDNAAANAAHLENVPDRDRCGRHEVVAHRRATFPHDAVD